MPSCLISQWEHIGNCDVCFIQCACIYVETKDIKFVVFFNRVLTLVRVYQQQRLVTCSKNEAEESKSATKGTRSVYASPVQETSVQKRTGIGW